MAMNATLDTSKANRRFIILAVVLGLIGAVLVYVAFSRDTGSDGGASSAANVSVVVAKADIAARTRLTKDMVEVKLVPADNVSELNFGDAAQVVGQVTRFPITANQQILSSQVISTSAGGGTSRALSFTIPKDKRAFAIKTDALSTVGGLLLPGDYVDLVVAFDVQRGNDTEEAYLVQTILQNIEVLAVSQTIVDTVGGDTAETTNGQRARNTEAKPQPEAATVTLMLTPDEVQLVLMADTHGAIRFALRSFGDGAEKPIEFLTEPDVLPANLP
jgi:pilus assembly protein CpaB